MEASKDVGPAEPKQELDVTTPEGLLLSLISQQAGAARPAVLLMMLEAQASSAKVSRPSLRRSPQSTSSTDGLLLLRGAVVLFAHCRLNCVWSTSTWQEGSYVAELTRASCRRRLQAWVSGCRSWNLGRTGR